MRETTRNQYQETNNRCVQNRKSTGTETAYRDHNQGIHCFAERIERGREGERETERERISFLAINSNYINPNNQSLF